MGMPINRRIFLGTGMTGTALVSRLFHAQTAHDVGDRPQLLWDDHLVDRKEGVRLSITPARADHLRLVSPDLPTDQDGVWAWVTVGDETRAWAIQTKSAGSATPSRKTASTGAPPAGSLRFRATGRTTLSSPSSMKAAAWTRPPDRANGTSASLGNGTGSAVGHRMTGEDPGIGPHWERRHRTASIGPPVL